MFTSRKISRPEKERKNTASLIVIMGDSLSAAKHHDKQLRTSHPILFPARDELMYLSFTYLKVLILAFSSSFCQLKTSWGLCFQMPERFSPSTIWTICSDTHLAEESFIWSWLQSQTDFDPLYHCGAAKACGRALHKAQLIPAGPQDRRTPKSLPAPAPSKPTTPAAISAIPSSPGFAGRGSQAQGWGEGFCTPSSCQRSW